MARKGSKTVAVDGKIIAQEWGGLVPIADLKLHPDAKLKAWSPPSPEDATFIYGLYDPIRKQVRYIGKTDDVVKRYSAHLAPRWLRDKTHKNHWIKSLLAQGIRPQMIILEAVPRSIWEDSERRWMFIFLMAGSRLVNMVPGGYGMHYATPEIRRKMGRPGRIPWNKGRKWTDEERRHHPRGMLGKVGYWRGKRMLPHVKEALRVANLGRIGWSKGLPMREETRQKLSLDWIVRDPQGQEFKVRNLAAFCRQHGLFVPLMNKVAHGLRRHHRGWACRKA